jgi:hypothetical protein
VDVEIRPSDGVGRLGTGLVDIVLYSYQSSKIRECIQAINASTFNIGHIQPEMFLGDGLERFKSVPAPIEFLVWIVREGSHPSSCLVLETTIPPFILSDSLGSLGILLTIQKVKLLVTV